MFAIIPLRMSELVALLLSSFECHFAVIDFCLFLTVPWVGLKCVIVFFSWSYSFSFCELEHLNLLVLKLIS